MKRTYILNITAFAIITGITFNQQTMQARSETAREIDKGSSHGEEVAGPVGAVAGGLLGAGVGAVKDTGDVLSGRTRDESIIIEDRYETPLFDENIYGNVDDELYANRRLDTGIYDDMDDELYTNGRSETAKEMEKGAASGEDLLGPVGAVAGGIVGAGVGLVKDTGEAVTGRDYEEELVREPSETETFMTDDDMDITMIPRDVSNNDNQLIMSDVD